jgi:4-hydroxybenzoate polyprenyltransferase
MYACMSFTVQSLGSEIVIDCYFVTGIISAFFMMLLIRNFDDLKDYELDKKIFPNRPIPRGDVKKSDIQLMAFSSFIIVLLANAIFAQKTLVVFLVMIVYALLTYKWFFAEKFHRSHVFFTMFTHQPLPIIINFFLIHTALASGTNYEVFSLKYFFVLLLFSFPVTIWETSRKIRSADMETEYETFSRFLGARNATLIPIILIFLTSILGVYFGLQLNLGVSFYIILLVLLVGVAFFYIRFFVKPTNENNLLKSVSMAFAGIFFLNLLAHIIAVKQIILLT